MVSQLFKGETRYAEVLNLVVLVHIMSRRDPLCGLRFFSHFNTLNSKQGLDDEKSDVCDKAFQVTSVSVREDTLRWLKNNGQKNAVNWPTLLWWNDIIFILVWKFLKDETAMLKKRQSQKLILGSSFVPRCAHVH